MSGPTWPYISSWLQKRYEKFDLQATRAAPVGIIRGRTAIGPGIFSINSTIVSWSTAQEEKAEKYCAAKNDPLGPLIKACDIGVSRRFMARRHDTAHTVFKRPSSETRVPPDPKKSYKERLEKRSSWREKS
ncbi:MAG: hypothetical protein HPY61_08750 [Methanotrichaceae archaeon]|nr:hypothetical protein [Methanotrichaceae archaeon]